MWQHGCVRYENLPLEAKNGRLISVEFVSNVYQAGDRYVVQCNVRDITKRKLAEEALHASELSYRRLFEAARDGILILDVDSGRITDVNPYLIKLLGFSHREMFGKTVGELSPFKDIEENQVMLERLQKDGYVRYEDLPLETKDGRKIAVEFVCNVYEAGDKKVIQCNVRDITDRKAAEKALWEREDLFSKAFRLSPDYMAIVRLADRTIIKANEAVCLLWGSTPDKVMGQPTRNYSNWLNEDERLVFMQTLQDKGECLNHETTLRMNDGRTACLNVSARMIVLNGESCILSVMSDITERKQMEEARRASEARYRTLFDCAPDGIVIADDKSYYLDANASMCRMLGYTYEELIGLNASDIVSRTEIEHIGPALNLIKARSEYHREWQFRRKDGSVFPAEVIATLMPDGNLMGMIRDITERKKAEDKILQLNAELEQRVVRTHGATGIRQRGTGSVQLFGLSRFARAAAPCYGLRGHAAKRSRAVTFGKKSPASDYDFQFGEADGQFD